MLSVIKRYSLQLVFTISLLLGLQLPNFLQQYELRLQGHFAEAKMQLGKFQSLADQYFQGDLQALIAQHKSSDVRVFKDEALLIESHYLRVQQLQQQIDILDQPIWYRLWSLSQQIKQPIVKEAWFGYQANIILNQQAILVGVVVAVLMMLCLEILLGLSKYCCCRIFSYVKQKPKKLKRKIGL
ncbi:DUF2937 family protein [Psychromonas sp. SA13A]|uniref:DUF2937 family protein n=1 Tax=Psychromonas sp. SA13A TaxID=2686346 RepID=UPI00140AD53E|nr:DUF2937 family protein [Psychromonas sp. SA13A]